MTKNYGLVEKCLFCKKEFHVSPYQKGKKKFCSMLCYGKFSIKNGTRRGINNGMWKGGIINDGFGYIKILKPEHPLNNNGYVLEHRLVIEKKIGRYLKRDEIVHHKNRNKSDNRIKNLELLTKKEHDLMHLKDYQKNNKGYTFDKTRNKWYVSISINGKMKYLGRFNTEQEAKNKVEASRNILNTL